MTSRLNAENDDVARHGPYHSPVVESEALSPADRRVPLPLQTSKIFLISPTGNHTDYLFSN